MPDYTQQLRQADIFVHITAVQLVQVEQFCKEHTYQPGETIFHEGSSNDEIYVIVQGEVDTSVDLNLVSDNPSME